MERKRSMGVTTFGVLIIATCLLSLVLAFNPKPYFEIYIKPYGVALYISLIVFTLLELILGFNILKLKEWARRYIVIFNIIYLGLLFVTPLMENPNFYLSQEQRFKQRQQQYTPEQKRRIEEANVKSKERISKYPPEQQERLRQMQSEVQENIPIIIMRVTKLFLYGISLLWYSLLIFFFTRPKVKEQFK